MAVLGVLVGWLTPVFYFLLLLLFTAFLGYCAYMKYVHMKYDHIPGPPRDSFIFGHIGTFMKLTRDDDKLIFDQFLKWSEKYGPVYRLNFLHTVIICVTCPHATKEILMSPKYLKDKQFHKRIFNLFGERFLGNGLVTVIDHDLWYKQRRIMDPAFSSLYLRGLMGTFNETAEKLMDKLSEEADNQTEVSMLKLVNCVTMDVIGKVAFGVELDLLNKSSPFPRAIEAVLLGLIKHARDIFFEYNPKNRAFIKEVREACRLLRTTGAQWINERKKAIENGENVPKDILTQIIKSAGQEESMTKEDEEVMLDNFVTFFIAGQETTANQLAFCIMELGRHPEVLEKLRQEIDEVIGMKRDVSYDDLGNLTYLSQVLKETLRLYATAPGTNRDIPEDIVIDGIHIPGGVTAMFSSYVSSRMEKFFKDPLKFDPERFHPDAPKPYYCYYPFSLGPRSCLGLNFAQMEAKVVMAKLIQRFDFTLVPGQSFDIMDTGTLRPKSGVLCTIKHRHSD
uniref:Cholesterol 24-hydroxylase n=1 Tax=Neogobius melanostomus TaxID=47308 RepID=A0A8C6WK66_9GOBI